MTPRDFCYWLQGFFEIADAGQGGEPHMTGAQVAVLRRHLGMVFAKYIDPTFGPEEVQKILDSVHHGPIVAEGHLPKVTYRC